MSNKKYSKNHIFFRKPCIMCDKMFRPTSKLNKICDKCHIKLNNSRKNVK